MSWKDDLTNIFAASVNQQTLEEAADELVFVSQDNQEYHKRYLDAFDAGVNAGLKGDDSIIAIVNASGFKVSTVPAALDLISELRQLYVSRYQEITGRQITR